MRLPRDLLIGAVPPAGIRDWHYLAVCLLAALALFAVTGTHKALAGGLNLVMAALLGMLTGIGGGMLQDALVNEILQCSGRLIFCCRSARCRRGGGKTRPPLYPSFAFMIAGALLCFWLRVMIIFRGWHLLITDETSVRESLTDVRANRFRSDASLNS